MTVPVRIYVNAKAVDALPGTTLIDALTEFDCDLAADIRAGVRKPTDSRGLPADLDAPVYQGAIFRVSGGTLAAEENH